MYESMQPETFSVLPALFGVMNSIPDPDEIKRVKVHPVKCPKCKLTVMTRPDDKVCPVCDGALPKPVER